MNYLFETYLDILPYLSIELKRQFLLLALKEVI